MRWIIECLSGWDQTREDANFATHFRLDQVETITVDGRDAGWPQTQSHPDALTLGQLYVCPALQRRGIGTNVLQTVLGRARREGKSVTLAVVKINPARHFYERHGFRPMHEDQYKVYMRRDAAVS